MSWAVASRNQRARPDEITRKISEKKDKISVNILIRKEFTSLLNEMFEAIKNDANSNAAPSMARYDAFNSIGVSGHSYASYHSEEPQRKPSFTESNIANNQSGEEKFKDNPGEEPYEWRICC